jgi:outer membrane protein assembly factor BamB
MSLEARLVGFGLAVALVSCGVASGCSKSKAKAAGDAGTPMNDAGTRPDDAGMPASDASAPASDAGAPEHDAGSPDGDAQAPMTNSVLQRGNQISRSGLFLQPTLTKAAVARFGRDFSFLASFPGAQWATPLYVENRPGVAGTYVAVNTSNGVFAFDEATSKTIWTTTIGPAAGATGAHCGNIQPLGILSTPVIDARSRTVYVAGAIGNAQTIERHEIHALSLDDGSERPGWPIDVAKATAGNAIPFMPPVQNQRGALALVGDVLYVPYGGHNGDCGQYHGWVIAVDVKDPTKIGAWATQGQGEGIWAPGGLASDGTAVFGVTGNNTAGNAAHLDSEEVVRLTGLAVLDRNDKNVYYPATWKAMDYADADFGSSSPLYVEVPGATPATYIAALSKDGHLYLLDSKNLGGMGGEIVDLQVATGNVIHTVPATYTTPRGVHVVFGTDANAKCPGGDGGSAIVSVLIHPGAPPTAEVVWCVPRLGGGTPIATTTDGINDAVVWFFNDNTLNALDGDTGQVLYGGRETSCGPGRQWTSPIAVKGRIITGIDGALCAFSARSPSPPDAAAGQ